jgi:hypothetical protein
MDRKKQGIYLAAYSVLLLFCVVGLFFQAGAWALVALECWTCLIFGSVCYYNRRINAAPMIRRTTEDAGLGTKRVDC